MTGSRPAAHPHDPFFRTGHQEGGESRKERIKKGENMVASYFRMCKA